MAEVPLLGVQGPGEFFIETVGVVLRGAHQGVADDAAQLGVQGPVDEQAHAGVPEPFQVFGAVAGDHFFLGGQGVVHGDGFVHRGGLHLAGNGQEMGFGVHKKPPLFGVLQFDDGFHFHGDVPGEDVHADGGAGGQAGFFAEDVHKELARAVGHLGLLVELVVGGHKDQELDDALYPVQIAHQGFQGGPAAPGLGHGHQLAVVIQAFFQGDVLADLADDGLDALHGRAEAGGVEEVIAEFPDGSIDAAPGGRCGELIAHAFQFCFYFHW